MIDISNFDNFELVFEEYSIMIPSYVIEKFQIEKKDQLIENDANNIFNIYIVIKKELAEQLWQEDTIKRPSIVFGKKYISLSDCINNESIYSINTYKDNVKIKTYNPS